MRVVFVHGWSVTSTETYGGLPEALVRNAPPSLELTIDHLYLAKYVTFADEVTLEDLAHGMQAAVRAEIQPKLAAGERFACVTHSTGAPVVRSWLQLFHRRRLGHCPLRHLVMLAPANHGSALAQLAQGKLARMKFFIDGLEPGLGVLEWLELGSDESWNLNLAWLDYDLLKAGLYTFVLTGQSIDRSFYDALNSYTGEAGSDGAVRAAAANLNFGFLRLEQQESGFKLSKEGQSQASAFVILPGLAHAGAQIGIMRSVTAASTDAHPTVAGVLACLQVSSEVKYRACMRAFDSQTAKTQAAERTTAQKQPFLFRRRFVTSRYCMLVFRIVDDRGNALKDYDILFTAGPDYDPNHLPPGFFVDRQRNRRNPGKLTYYVDHDVMAEWFARPELDDRFGFRIAARPDEGYAYYSVGEHRGRFSALRHYFRPNQTLMIEVQLHRRVRADAYRLTQQLSPETFG